MSTYRRFSTNPRRRERLVNLAEFNRATADPKSLSPPVELQTPGVPEEAESQDGVVGETLD